MHPVIVSTVFTTMNVYEDCINLFNLCLCYWAFYLMHTQIWCSHTFYSYLFLSLPLHLCTPPSLHLPSPTLFLPFPLCCCKAFPWLAVINLPSLGAGSWLRASERSYKAKTAIQTQSRLSCFQSTTYCSSRCCSPQGNTAPHNKGMTLDAASHMTPQLISIRLETHTDTQVHLLTLTPPFLSQTLTHQVL